MVATIRPVTMPLTSGMSPKTSSTQIPIIVTVVLTLPDQAAAMTRCCSTATRRRSLTPNSRNSTMATAQPGMLPFSTKKTMAASTSILSARGSINLPKSVTW